MFRGRRGREREVYGEGMRIKDGKRETERKGRKRTKGKRQDKNEGKSEREDSRQNCIVYWEAYNSAGKRKGKMVGLTEKDIRGTRKQ